MDRAKGQAGGGVRETIAISIVWQHSTWPSHPLLVSAEDDFAVSGVAAPRMRVSQVRVAKGALAIQTINTLLTASARARIKAGQGGFCIFGRRIRRDQVLHEGDRVELLGPITANPKSDRHQRVAAQRREAERSVWRGR